MKDNINSKKSDSSPSFREKVNTVWNGVKLFFRSEPTAPGIYYERFSSYISRNSKNIPPQELQGLWQAYGQIRGAKTTGRFALLTSITIGIGLWGSQQILSEQTKELEKREKLLKDREVILNELKDFMENQLLPEYNVYEKQFNIANQRARAACQDDKECLSAYERELKDAEELATQEAEEILSNMSHSENIKLIKRV